MSRRAWAFVLAGVLAGALGAWGLERVYQSRLRDVEAQLAVVDQRLRERAAVKTAVDGYLKQKDRYEAQLRAIDEERARLRCPGLLLAELELDRQGAPVDGMTLGGGTLALVGRAESEADWKALAESVRAAKWARAVRSGGAPGGEGRALRFGVLASVEPPACPVLATPAASPATPHTAPPAEAPAVR
jgi:hypothetical protein